MFNSSNYSVFYCSLYYCSCFVLLSTPTSKVHLQKQLERNGNTLLFFLPTQKLHHTTRLFEHAINLILIIQFQHFGCLIGFNAFAVQQETKRCRLHALALRVGFKDLGHFGRFLDFEKGFFASLCGECNE